MSEDQILEVQSEQKQLTWLLAQLRDHKRCVLWNHSRQSEGNISFSAAAKYHKQAFPLASLQRTRFQTWLSKTSASLEGDNPLHFFTATICNRSNIKQTNKQNPQQHLKEKSVCWSFFLSLCISVINLLTPRWYNFHAYILTKKS